MAITREQLHNDYLLSEETKKNELFNLIEYSIRQGVVSTNKLGETRFVSKYYPYPTEYIVEFIDKIQSIFVDSKITSIQLPDGQFIAIVVDWTIDNM
jgi:hypothetical protein